MKSLQIIMMGTLLFVVAGIAQTKTTPTKRSDVGNPSKFQFLTINGNAAASVSVPCDNNLEFCGNARIGLFGYEGFGGTDSENPKTETFIFKNGKKTTGVYLFTMRIDDDDSVAGERVRLSFELKKGKWYFVQAGRQFRCARGSMRNWTKALCP